MKYLSFELLKNEATARNFLIKKYPKSEAKTLAYRNVHAFTSYIKQGMALFQTAKQSDFWSSSFLLYYGMMSLLKGFALSIDPNYPHSTTILQHGLTSPKRKKEPYRFFYDEVRVQKDGFFPYLCNLFSHPVPAGERFKLELLCSFIPDLQILYQHLDLKTHWWNVTYQNGTLTCPIAVLDQLCISAESFVYRLNHKKPAVCFSIHSITDQSFQLKPVGTNDILGHPWLRQNRQGKLYLWNASHTSIDPLPEILTYYALFFSLSMLCRYDPPVWFELNNDIEKEQLIIQQLIDLALHNFPDLLHQLF
ncbi:YaaC family protein [Shimazuella sp. AN120528]|uniref:YaaC family protein n=1 Tax=Shimazuella soli TaxID=1892854 RepID=UPI001F0FF159|nr:YaaC family protein [Shimazuella soli]MCH5585028.1 YaaC family protein [Shimazuella soli]